MSNFKGKREQKQAPGKPGQQDCTTRDSNMDIYSRAVATKTTLCDDFDTHYRELAPRMYGVAYRMVNNQQDALDIVQEAFIKAFDNRHKFRGTSSVSTWMYRITVNLSYDFLRRRQRMRLEEVETDTYTESAETERNGRNVIMKDVLDLIKEEIDKLPPRQKSVFILKTYEEMKYSEIAGILNSRVGTVKSTYFQAVQKLKKNVRIKEVIRDELQTG